MTRLPEPVPALSVPAATVTPEPPAPDPERTVPGPPAAPEVVPDPVEPERDPTEPEAPVPGSPQDPDTADDRPGAGPVSGSPGDAREVEDGGRTRTRPQPRAEDLGAPDEIRVRFCPSPTGNPHVGLVRTALYNWAFARHTGGTFVFRIEDTDAARDTEQSYRALLDAMRWLGLDWDEGPEVGGPVGPYRQSERSALYAEVADRLREAGALYESFSTTEEVQARHRAADRDPKLGYDNADRDLTDDERAAFREAGRTPSLRLRMPDTDLTWNDLVKGTVTFAAGTVPDPVLVRSSGEPLYTLTNPVDDAQMRITHVLRGEDLLSSTPRQLALHAHLVRLGMSLRVPFFGHLPYVTGEGNRKLSKRDPESSLDLYRERGFLPEGLLNYLALLGWSFGGDREVFSVAEMAEQFDIARVSSNPARFDLRKAEAINGEWMRRLDPADFAARVLDRLVGAGVVSDPPSESDRALVAAAAPLVQERVVVLADAEQMLGFLFAGDGFAVDGSDAGVLDGSGDTLRAAREALAGVAQWSTGAVQEALRTALVDGLGLKPRVAFGPVRVAVTGRKVSPPLFESIELLGRDTTLARLDAALARSGRSAT